MRFLFSLALIFWPSMQEVTGHYNKGPSGASLTIVQHKVNASCPASATCSVTVTSTGSGNLIIVGSGYANTAQLTASVSGGGTYTVCTACAGFGTTNSPQLGAVISYTLSSTSGATSISVTLSATPSGGMETWAREYSCSGGTLSFDVGNSAIDTSGASLTGASLTTTGTNEVVVQHITDNQTATAISAPYGNADFPAGDGVADLLNTTSGTAPTWTLNVAGVAVVSGIAVKCQ